MNGSFFLGTFDPGTSLQKASQVQVVRFQKWGRPARAGEKCGPLEREQYLMFDRGDDGW